MSAQLSGDPNTDHQVWSEWQCDISTANHANHATIETAWMKISKDLKWAGRGRSMIEGPTINKLGVYAWKIRTQVEGPPVQDPSYRNGVERVVRKFFRDGLGTGTDVTMRSFVLSGEPIGGGSRSQLIEAPLSFPLAVD